MKWLNYWDQIQIKILISIFLSFKIREIVGWLLVSLRTYTNASYLILLSLAPLRSVLIKKINFETEFL